ncbi:MAG TPA: pilus assembly PilX N-terminal domain-containing protein, partial [Candidatus Eisenbacteria bacterium]|nr:pilus assembly PilX N-terminal domain-containing protein [Candidatus Eisenbacteria bacterium]
MVPASNRPVSARQSESGNALVAALLILMVLTAAGVAFMAVTKSEKQISGNAVVATEAFYNAEAGISEGLYRMSFKKDSLNFIGPTGPETPGWGRYIVHASGASDLDPDHGVLGADGLDNDEDGFIDESGERYPEILSKQDAGDGGMQYPYVRVEYKTQGGQLVRYGDADQNAVTPPKE